MTLHACGCCGAKYDTMQAALLCCDPDFDTNPDPPADAYGEAPPADVPPERHERYTDRHIDLRTDGGHDVAIELASLPYECRNCQLEQTVYVNAERLDGERVVDAHNARLIRTYCDDCHHDRVFVLATEGADAARDEHPIQAVRDLHRKRRGVNESHTLRADGGVPDVPADTTVFVATTHRGSRHSTVFHTDRDCPRLQSSNNIHEKQRGVLKDTKTHCKFCAGVAETPEGDNSTYNALKTADPGDLVTDGGGCPKCGAPTQVEGGCPTCTQCPWSKCGGGF
jgi:hypothetical protein